MTKKEILLLALISAFLGSFQLSMLLIVSFKNIVKAVIVQIAIHVLERESKTAIYASQGFTLKRKMELLSVNVFKH